MTTRAIGDIALSRVVESEQPLLRPAELYPDWNAAVMEEHARWLVPRFYDPLADRLAITIQSFLLKTRHHTILVDACSGNHKTRERQFFNHREWPWLRALAAAGACPEDIDYVLCTHLHVDHVGWNTMLRDGSWVPTFPNAKYLFSHADWEYWRAESAANGLPRTGDYIADSVLPIVEAGRAVMTSGCHEIEAGVWIEPTPGHSPGHVVVHVESGAKHAIVSGDIMHHPIQCRFPDWSTNFCADQQLSRQTRRRFFETYCDTGVLIAPAHFPTPTVGFIESEGRAFRFRFEGE